MRGIKNNSQGNIITTVSKLMLGVVLLCSLLIAQCGIEFNRHTCSHSGHQHLDIDLIAGSEALMFCLDEESDCCTGHNESEEDCDGDCTDDEDIVHAELETFSQHQSIHVVAPACINLFASDIAKQTAPALAEVKTYICQPINKNAAQTHSRLCALLCTMLC